MELEAKLEKVNIVLGKERVDEIRKTMFGDKQEFSRSDFLAFTKRLREEAVKAIFEKDPTLKPSKIGEELNIDESLVRYYLKKLFQ